MTKSALALLTTLALAVPAFSRQREPEVEYELSVGPAGMTITPKGSYIVSLHQYFNPVDRVIEFTKDGEIRPFPTEAISRNAETAPIALDAVQGLESDGEGVVWMLDNGRRGETVPKIVAWDTVKNKLHRVIHLPTPATLPTSYLNDLALDPERPVLYIADPASGDDAAIIIVNRDTGGYRRVLQGHFSVIPEDIPMVIEGRPFQARRPDGSTVQPQTGVNPIAVDRKGKWLYFGPLKGRTLYRISTDHLNDPKLRPVELASRVEGYAEKPICDDISIDAKGNIYLADIENNAIGIIDEKERKYALYETDPNFLWPGGLCFGTDGRLHFFTCQLNRTRALNAGTDATRPPFHVYKIKAKASGTVGR